MRGQAAIPYQPLRSWINKKTNRMGVFRKAGSPAEKAKGVRAFVRTPFHTPCPARYSVLHYDFSEGDL